MKFGICNVLADGTALVTSDYSAPDWHDVTWPDNGSQLEASRQWSGHLMSST